MSLRKLVWQNLTQEPILSSRIPPQRWLEGGAVLETPERPFAVLRYQGVTPGLSRVRQTRLEAWVHDEPGSYDLIETVLRHIRFTIEGLPGDTDDEGGVYVIETAWEGDSVDLFDDAYRTNTKSAQFLITGTGF